MYTIFTYLSITLHFNKRYFLKKNEIYIDQIMFMVNHENKIIFLIFISKVMNL